MNDHTDEKNEAQIAAEKAVAAAVKKEEREAAKAAKAAAKEAEKAAKEAEKAAKEVEKEAEKAAKLAEKEAAKEAAKAAKAAAKEAEKMPEANGIRRPKPLTLCGQAWAIFDEVSMKNGAPASIKESLEIARARGLNEGNVRVEYARWRKFFGITGRIAPPVVETQAEENQSEE